jgi:hypothetical protein
VHFYDVIFTGAAFATIIAMLTQGRLLGGRSGLRRRLLTPARILMAVGDRRRKASH